MLAVPGAVPVDGILPKSVANVNILNTDGANTLYIADSNYANNLGDPIPSGQNWYKQFDRNLFYLPDWYVQGNGQGFSIDITSV